VVSVLGVYETDGLFTEHLFGTLQLARPRANAQALEEGYVELGVDPAV